MFVDGKHLNEMFIISSVFETVFNLQTQLPIQSVCSQIDGKA